MISIRTIAQQFPEWTLGQSKAYRSGVSAGLKGRAISEDYVYAESDDSEDDLTEFFLRGYADAIGAEAESAEWFDSISDWRIQERWWV